MMQNLRDGRIEQEAGQVMAQKKEARRGTSAGCRALCLQSPCISDWRCTS
ncbi:hypothetical protein [Ralstonia mannitolilytica]|nr:hypothetical protein [Ralstonia mannitolilytica]